MDRKTLVLGRKNGLQNWTGNIYIPQTSSTIQLSGEESRKIFYVGCDRQEFVSVVEVVLALRETLQDLCCMC